MPKSFAWVHRKTEVNFFLNERKLTKKIYFCSISALFLFKFLINFGLSLLLLKFPYFWYFLRFFGEKYMRKKWMVDGKEQWEMNTLTHTHRKSVFDVLNMSKTGDERRRKKLTQQQQQVQNSCWIIWHMCIQGKCHRKSAISNAFFAYFWPEILFQSCILRWRKVKQN